MDYRLKNQGIIEAGLPLIDHGLECYDTLDDPAFDLDREGILQKRSAFELVRASLTDDQRAELDLVDTHWQAHAQDFDEAFATLHHQADRKTVLRGYVVAEDGSTPPIPRAHWWWKPIEGSV